MKKRAKLRLNRETLRLLESGQADLRLARVVGASPLPCIFATDCECTNNPCTATCNTGC